MSITRLPEIVFPLAQVNKVNEIVDVLNENLNMYYSVENPQLVPVEGVATWTVTHNLGTENINCSLFNGDNLVISNVSIVSENVVSVSFNASSSISEGTYKIVIISNGAGSSSGSGSYVLPTASTTTLGGVRIDGSSIKINNGVISSTVDSTLSDISTNPVQNKIITNTFYDNFRVDANNYIIIDDSTSPDYNINGFSWKAPSNGLLSFRNIGSSSVSSCGVVQSNTFVGQVRTLSSSDIITYYLVKNIYYYIVRKNTAIEVRFYPVVSGL